MSSEAGIYFLVLHGSLAYIGQSNRVSVRVAGHVGEKAFDAAWFLPRAASDLSTPEASFIALLRPFHNRHADGRLGLPTRVTHREVTEVTGVRCGRHFDTRVSAPVACDILAVTELQLMRLCGAGVVLRFRPHSNPDSKHVRFSTAQLETVVQENLYRSMVVREPRHKLQVESSRFVRTLRGKRR